MSTDAAPSGIESDNDYKSRTGQSEIPVQSDEAPIDSGINPDTEDSDAQLEKDDADAIDKSNIIDSKTRGAGPSGGYKEPGDEEGLPGPEDGTSSVA